MLRFLDCNASIGRWKHPALGSYETAAELETILDYLQVEGAVVYHSMAHEIHPNVGNPLLMEELAGRERLLASWVIFSPLHRRDAAGRRTGR